MSTKDPEQKQGRTVFTGPNAHDSPQACPAPAWETRRPDGIRSPDSNPPYVSSGAPAGAPGEQRIKSRFKAYALAVTLTRRTCLGLARQSHRAFCMDINRYGVGLISPAPLSRGSRISLDFQGRYINQSGVQAEVVSQAPLSGGGYRLGIRFLYCASQKAYCRRLDNALSRIEAMCRQKNMGRKKNAPAPGPMGSCHNSPWQGSSPGH